MTDNDHAADLAAFVRLMYDELEHGDGATFAAALAPDVRTLDERTGRWAYGPGELAAKSEAEIKGADSYRHWIDEVDARMVGPELGLVTYVWHADAVWGGEQYNIRCPSSLLARREADGWKIVLMHSVPAEERAADGQS